MSPELLRFGLRIKKRKEFLKQIIANREGMKALAHRPSSRTRFKNQMSVKLIFKER
jgi:hypothetical protein